MLRRLTLVVAVFALSAQLNTSARADGGFGQDACGYYLSPIITDGFVPLGNMVLTNTPTDVYFEARSKVTEGWYFSEFHFYVSATPIAMTSAGTPDIGGLAMTATLTTPQDWYMTSVPMPEFGGSACGQTLYVAVKVIEVQLNSAGEVINRAFSWAYGEWGSANWGPTFTYNVCCDPRYVDSGCTRTQGYWKNHSMFGRRAQFVPWTPAGAERERLCSSDSRTQYEILRTSTRGNAYLILAHQYIAAKLNIASGASVTPEVDAAMAQALTLITDRCGEFVRPSSEDGMLMTLYAEILDGYNNGDVGPGHCGDADESEIRGSRGRRVARSCSRR